MLPSKIYGLNSPLILCYNKLLRGMCESPTLLTSLLDVLVVIKKWWPIPGQVTRTVVLIHLGSSFSANSKHRWWERQPTGRGRDCCWQNNWEDWWFPSLLFPNASAWGQRCRSGCARDSKIHSRVSALLEHWLMRPKWHRKQAVLRKENSQAFLSLMISTKAVPIHSQVWSRIPCG